MEPTLSPSSDQTLVSIVIPCLNESKTLGMVIEEGKNALQKADVAGEIVVADNGSTDGSQEIAQNLGARVVHITHKGYGAAIDGGIKAAKGTYILFADADMSYPIIELDKMLEPLKMGTADFVLGSRLRGTIEAGAMPFLNRYLGTPFLSLLIKIFYGLKTSDCNSGMRIFHKKIYHPLQLVCTGMEYASEMLIRIGEHQIKYQEVPISFRKDRRDRPPHLKRWRDGWSHLRFILANASWSFLITIPFALSSFFLLFSFFLSLSDLWWPQKPLRLHTCFLLCGLAWPLLMFGVIQILIKSILSETMDVFSKHTILKKIHSIHQKGSFFYISLCFFTAALIEVFYIFFKWYELNFQELFELSSVVRSLIFITIGTTIFACDMGLGFIKIIPKKIRSDSL